MIPLPTDKYGTTRTCSCCDRTLPLAQFHRKFSRHQNGKVVVSRTCRTCRRVRGRDSPAFRRAVAFMVEARSRPCSCCGQRVHPDATIFVPPAGSRWNIGAYVGQIQFKRLRERVAASTMLCANCWQVRRVAAQRARRRYPVSVARVDTSKLRAALMQRERQPDLADVPPALPPPDIAPPPAHSLTDSARQGRGEAPPKSMSDNAS